MIPFYPAEIRRHALEAIRRQLFTVLLITLIATVPSLVLTFALSLSSTSFYRALLMYQNASMTMDVLRRVLQAAVHDMGRPALLLWQILPFLYLMLPFLRVGQNYAYLRLLRGEEIRVTDVFARAGCFFKAILLELMIAVKTLLWILPGFAIMTLGMLLTMQSESMFLFGFTYLASMGVMVVLGVRASLRYSLAAIRMADEPENGAWSCLKESIRLMNGRLMQLFSVLLTFLLFILLEEVAVNLVASLLYALGLLLNVALNLFLNAWQQTSVCLYYMERRREDRHSEIEEKSAFELDSLEDNGPELN